MFCISGNYELLQLTAEDMQVQLINGRILMARKKGCRWKGMQSSAKIFGISVPPEKGRDSRKSQ